MREGPVTWCSFGENDFIEFVIVSVIMNIEKHTELLAYTANSI